MEGELDKIELDTIIAGYIKRLPKPGAVWPQTERDLWLKGLEDSFLLIYKLEPKIA